MRLNAVEVRIVGSLIEKELTTPQYYPLTLNALTAACNQTSNRDPVMHLGEDEVRAALDALKEKGVARVVHSTSNRALKFRQVIHEVFALERDELAVLGVLLLRGPQTVGELRGRTERAVAFDSLDDVERVIDRLGQKVEPLAVRLPRQPGQKEGRVAHLLSGSPAEAAPPATHVAVASEPYAPLRTDAAAPAPDLAERVAGLEQQVEELTGAVALLYEHIDRLLGEGG